ncbi:MAG: tRNA (N6-isopentenyl adenosine(37)-C2)-methylthiotransferase MiaB [Acidobacteriota bacterium]
MTRTFYIETHGCQMNEHDSEKIAGLLSRRGFVPACSAEEADVFLLNTCSVREKAAQKVYSRLGELRQRKRRDPSFVIGVVGCVAQQEGEAMLRRAPYIDLVVGTHLYHELPDLLDEVQAREGTARSATRFLETDAPVEIDAVARATRFRASITIMEGCNKHCAFCIVPHTRGRERNRPSRLILAEARRALDEGYIEILLLGQTVNSYRDPERRGYRFADLLADLSELPGLRRLRFTSPHPRHFTDDVIRLLGERPVICDQVHVPVQSGSTPVLRRMRRQHSREWYLELVEKLRNCGRYLALSTDVIIGFPGETEADFELTLDLVQQVRYEQMFSFKYSVRPFTEAADWADDVPEAVKARRLMELQRLQREIQLDLHRERYLGREFELLVEGRARDGVRRSGRTTTGKVVNFLGDEQPGDLTWVRITAVGPNSLTGEPVVQCRLAEVV